MPYNSGWHLPDLGRILDHRRCLVGIKHSLALWHGSTDTESSSAMPGHGGRSPHASSSFVWTEWNADIKYGAGFTFVAGMLNGAFAVGTPDVTTYVSRILITGMTV